MDELEAKKLSTDDRKEMDSHEFALPSKRMFPMPDENHVRLAWDMVDRAKDLSPEERAEARRNILRKAHAMGIDTSDWKTTVKASAVSFTLADYDDNRMPFKGILTYFDAPSDKPPGGSGGRRVLIPSSVGIPALESLKAMGVNFIDEMDDHDVTKKIGVITDAYTGELTAHGLEVWIEGYIYAKDFPKEASAIKLNQSQLGFSYETSRTLLASEEIGGEEIAVAHELSFTGAAILLKKAAAYQHTSIAARKEDDIPMTVDELKELLAGFKAELTASMDAKFSELEAAKAPKKGAKEDDSAGDDNNDPDQDGDADKDDDNDGDGMESNNKDDKVKDKKGEVKASMDENQIKELVAAAVKEALAAVKEEKAVEVQAAAEIKPVAPKRETVQFGNLLAKYDVKSEEGVDVYASIDKTAEKAGLDTSTRLALKMAAWLENNK